MKIPYDANIYMAQADQPQAPTAPIPEPCPNCGSAMVERFCSHCGQNQTRNGLTIKALIIDAVNELSEADGRVWLTLRRLLFKPGRITRDYLQYRRARYISPFRIYLFTNLVLYFVIGLFDSGVRVELDTDAPDLPANTGLFDPSQAEIVPQIGFIMLPVLAAGLGLVFFRRRLAFGNHFVAALHLKSGIAILITCTALINGLWSGVEILLDINLRNIGGMLFLLTVATAVVYAITSLQVIYGGNLLLNIVRGLMLLIAYFVTAAFVLYLVGAALVNIAL